MESPAKMQKLAASVVESAVLQVKKLTEHAIVPQRASAHAAGYDLFAAYDCVVPARGKALVKTDIAIALPEGVYGRVGECTTTV